MGINIRRDDESNLRELSGAIVVTPAIARHIVEHAGANLGLGVSVTRTSGIVIASSQPDLVGACHNGAFDAIQSDCVVSSDRNGSPSVACPLTYEDKIVGGLVLHGDPGRGRETVRITETLAELIIHQMTVIERLRHDESHHHQFMSELLFGRIADAADAGREAAILGINLTVPRVVIAVRVDQVLNQTELPARINTLPSIARDHRLSHGRNQLLSQGLLATFCMPNDICAIVDDTWLAILVEISLADAELRYAQLAQRMTPLVQEIEKRAEVGICAGVGRYYAGWTGLAQSFANARFAADAGCRLVGSGRVCDYRGAWAGFVRR